MVARSPCAFIHDLDLGTSTLPLWDADAEVLRLLDAAERQLSSGKHGERPLYTPTPSLTP